MEINLLDTLEQMDKICPVKCRCNISMDGIYIRFEWRYTIERVPYCYEYNITKIEYNTANIDIIGKIIHNAGREIRLVVGDKNV